MARTTQISKKAEDGELVEVEVTLPDEAAKALMKFTKAESLEEALGRAVLLIKTKPTKAKP